MIIHDPSKRRAASMLARCGVVFSVVGLGISAWNMSFSGVPGAAAATDGGAAQVVYPADAGPDAGQPLAGGGSATPFSLALPAGAACSEDSANGDFRVQSYMVPETFSPNDLTFDSSGPTPQGYQGALADFRMPLWDVTQAPYADAQTAAADPPGGPGPIINIPAFSFGLYVAGDVPAGTYNIGIACTDPARVIEKYWNARITVTTAGADQPAGFTWAVASGGGSTTTTTTGGGDTTSTTTGGGDTTTTTAGGGDTTTTTAGGGTTSTTGGANVGGGSFTGGTPSAASPVTTAGQLPYTGSSPIPTVVWAIVLIVFGRTAMLLGKRPKVVGDDPTG